MYIKVVKKEKEVKKDVKKLEIKKVVKNEIELSIPTAIENR